MRKTRNEKGLFLSDQGQGRLTVRVDEHTDVQKSDEDKDVPDRVDTFIGRSDRDEFTKVAHTKNLSRPGTIFRYASYIQEQEAFLPIYLDCYHTNLKGKVYTNKGAYYVLKLEA